MPSSSKEGKSIDGGASEEGEKREERRRRKGKGGRGGMFVCVYRGVCMLNARGRGFGVGYVPEWAELESVPEWWRW